MTMDASNNRRTGPRAQVDLWVDEIDDDGSVYYQRATNLSLGGLFLDRTLPHPPGTHLTLCLSLQDDPIKIEGEVVDAPRELGMGVRFVNVTEGQHRRLARYLNLSEPHD